MSAVEKAIAAGLEPLVDSIVEFEKKLQDLSKKLGEFPQPLSMEDVVLEVIAKFGDDLKGEKGDNAPAPDIEAIVSKLFETYGEQLRGKDAEPPNIDLEHIAQLVFDNYSERLKGKDADTPVIDLDRVAESVMELYGDRLKGQDGQAPSVDEVVGAVVASPEFLRLRGDKGDKGESPTAEEVADVYARKHALSIKGDKGDKGDRGQDGWGIQAKAWQKGIYREDSVVQHHLGQFFRALSDTTDEPGDSEHWERLGTQGFRWTGVKKPDFAYKEGDLYIDEGTTFLWTEGKGRMFAKRGDPGKPGIKGDKGDKGDRGTDGISITSVLFEEGTFVFTTSKGDALVVDSSEFDKYVTGLVEKTLLSSKAFASITERLGK